MIGLRRATLYLLGQGLSEENQALTSATGCLAADLARDKDLAKLLTAPDTDTAGCRLPSQAVEAARKLGVPVVVNHAMPMSR